MNPLNREAALDLLMFCQLGVESSVDKMAGGLGPEDVVESDKDMPYDPRVELAELAREVHRAVDKLHLFMMELLP